MTSPALLAHRKANKPPEFVPVPICGSQRPYPVVNWQITQREVWWSHDADNWMTTDVEVVGRGRQLSETEARAEAALLNARMP